MECTGMYYIVAVCLTVIVGVSGDTPANCSYEQILGTWEFKLGPGGNNNTLNCTDYDVLKTYTVSLYFPDIAFDQDGNKGFWTLIYNQGFEVVIMGRKYFAFFLFRNDQ
ncbi:hypothetical protein ScPMuIL_008407 [Solemya velum]